MCLDTPKAQPSSVGLLHGQGKEWDKECIKSLHCYCYLVFLPFLKFLIHVLDKVEAFGQEDLVEAMGVVVTEWQGPLGRFLWDSVLGSLFFVHWLCLDHPILVHGFSQSSDDFLLTSWSLTSLTITLMCPVISCIDPFTYPPGSPSSTHLKWNLSSYLPPYTSPNSPPPIYPS